MSHGNTVVHRFQENVRKFGSKPFLIVDTPAETATITYSEMYRRSARHAAALRSSGQRGVVLIFLPQGSAGISYFLGAMMAGLLPSFMPSPSAKQDAGIYWSSHIKLFEQIDPVAIVTDRALSATMEKAGLLRKSTRVIIADGGIEADGFEVTDTPSSWPALLQHSSGTTGLKKGVMLSHDAVLLQIDAYAAALDINAEDVVVSWLPVYHDMGLMACTISPMVLGQTVVLLDPFLWVSRPASLFKAIAKYAGTLCWMPNFAFNHTANLVRPDTQSMSLASMRAFINCSEPCHAATFRRFQEKFSCLGVAPKMLQTCYALAETVFASSQTSVNRPPRVLVLDQNILQEEQRIAEPSAEADAIEVISNGPPLAGVTITIRDEQEKVLPDGFVGEVWIEAPFLFDGYNRMPELTQEKLVAGSYRTADRGFVADGEIYILGRLDDLLILNGRNVHAAEIEGLLADIDGLKPGRAVAFCEFSDTLGSNQLIIVGETTADADKDSILAAVRKVIFDHLSIHPGDIVLVEQGWLTKTTSGKISRTANAASYRQLRERLVNV